MHCESVMDSLPVVLSSSKIVYAHWLDNNAYIEIAISEIPRYIKMQWSGTDTVEFHILSQTPNGKRTRTTKTTL